MLDLAGIDVEEIATALADQTDYEHRWLIDPRTGEVVFWTSDTGIDGENPVEFDELDLILIDPLPSYVWYQDMVDFADGISDRAAGRRLSGSLQGRGAFRRFKNQLYEHHPELISAWHALCDARAQRRPSIGCWTRNSSTTVPPRSLVLIIPILRSPDARSHDGSRPNHKARHSAACQPSRMCRHPVVERTSDGRRKG